MPFTWADYLTVANTLNAAGDEASLRAAVSRAYYAVFGEAKEAAETEKGEEFSTGSIHEAVINYFDGSTDNSRKAFAANLKRLKSSRVRADYHRNRVVDARYASQAISEATNLLTDLSAISSSSGSK